MREVRRPDGCLRARDETVQRVRWAGEADERLYFFRWRKYQQQLIPQKRESRRGMLTTILKNTLLGPPGRYQNGCTDLSERARQQIVSMAVSRMLLRAVGSRGSYRIYVVIRLSDLITVFSCSPLLQDQTSALTCRRFQGQLSDICRDTTLIFDDRVQLLARLLQDQTSALTTLDTDMHNEFQECKSNINALQQKLQSNVASASEAVQETVRRSFDDLSGVTGFRHRLKGKRNK